MAGDRAERATIAIWEFEVWWRAQLEGDRAATAACELVVCLVADEGDSYNCYLRTRILGGRPSWKMGYNCNLGTRAFLWWLGWFDCNVRPGFSWRRALENYLSMALSTLLSGQPMYVLVYCAAVSGSEME